MMNYMIFILLFSICIALIMYVIVNGILEYKRKKNIKALEKTILKSFTDNSLLVFKRKSEDPFVKVEYVTVIDYAKGFVQYKTTTDSRNTFISSMSLDDFYMLYEFCMLNEKIKN